MITSKINEAVCHTHTIPSQVVTSNIGLIQDRCSNVENVSLSISNEKSKEKGDNTMLKVESFLNYYQNLKVEKISKDCNAQITILQNEDPAYKILTKHREQIRNEIIKSSRKELELSEISICIESDLLSESTKKEIRKVNQECQEKIMECKKQVERIKMLCSLTDNEDRIFKILMDNNIITDYNKINLK